jgi:hypothetical protein
LKEGIKEVRLNLMVSAFPREPEGVYLIEALTNLGLEVTTQVN